MENVPDVTGSESLYPVLSKKGDGTFIVKTITEHQKELADYFLNNGLCIQKTSTRFHISKEKVQEVLHEKIVNEYIEKHISFIAQESELSTHKVMSKLNEIVDGLGVENSVLKALELAARIHNMVKPNVLAVQINHNPLESLTDEELDKKIKERIEDKRNDNKSQGNIGVVGREG